LIGQVFKTLGKHLPPPAGAKSPALWGTRERLMDMFGAAAASIAIEPRVFNFRCRSPEHFLDVLKTYYGPMLKTFAALDEARQDDLTTDLISLLLARTRPTTAQWSRRADIWRPSLPSGDRRHERALASSPGPDPPEQNRLGWVDLTPRPPRHQRTTGICAKRPL
jgi:hypothetical protein